MNKLAVNPSTIWRRKQIIEKCLYSTLPKRKCSCWNCFAEFIVDNEKESKEIGELINA